MTETALAAARPARGINVDPSNPAGAPDPALLARRNITAVRLVSKADPNGSGVLPIVEDYGKRAIAAGLFVLPIVTNESQGRIPANNSGVIQYGNEPDGQPPSSMVQTPDQFVSEFNIYAAAHPQFQWIAGGLAAGDPQARFWRQVAPRLERCAGVSVHLYGSSILQAEAIIEGHRAVTPGLPVWVTEWNPLNDPLIPAYDWMLRQRTAGAFFFCWSDGMVPDLGVVTADGTPKPSLDLLGRPLPPTPPPVPPAPSRWKTLGGLRVPTFVDGLLLITANYMTNQESIDFYGQPRTIQGLVWHDMEGYEGGAISRWDNPASQASAHLSILRDGRVMMNCPLELITFHAGTNNVPGSGVYGRTAFWRTHNANPATVGIEAEGFYNQSYDARQIATATRIARWFRDEYGVPLVRAADQFRGHHEHREISSARLDPGDPWPLDDILRRAG
jgi:hypothetical protein